MDYGQVMAERMRIEGIMRQIRVIDEKLSACRPVKAALSAQQTSLDSAVENWVNVRQILLSDVRYTEIVTTDVFEGEMANRLKEYISEVLTDINDGISASELLLDELQAQIGKLEEYEAELSAERASLAAQL